MRQRYIVSVFMVFWHRFLYFFPIEYCKDFSLFIIIIIIIIIIIFDCFFFYHSAVPVGAPHSRSVGRTRYHAPRAQRHADTPVFSGRLAVVSRSCRGRRLGRSCVCHPVRLLLQRQLMCLY